MTIDADTAAAAMTQTWEHLLRADPDRGWSVRQDGVFAMVVGVNMPVLNGVWSVRADPDPGILERLLDRVAGSGLAHCLQLRPGVSPALAGLAAARGMSEGPEPLMVLADPARLDAAKRAAAQGAVGLEIRQLDPDEAAAHVAVAATGFGAPEELFAEVMTPALLGAPGVRCYVGEAGGRPVTTGIGLTLGPFTGVFNVATVPAGRRRGYGAALTARAVSDGLAAGASWSWLQASPDGYGVYERLGFRTVETWRVWVRVP
ncbi:MAG TPA: GNAT family N-acetyltransferase [Trebonia sp.]|jgi:hypothetical protein|nr:GNAT family N-acetyltransferase [Trebonia sp.]